MKEIVGQTKEFVKDLMISAFGNYLPELKKLESFPFIARSELLGDNRGLFWIWMLPNGIAITYGNELKHQFGITSQSKMVYIAEVGAKTKDINLYSKAKAKVIVVDYLNNGKIVTDKVLIIDAQDMTPHNHFGDDEFQFELVQTTEIRINN